MCLTQVVFLREISGHVSSTLISFYFNTHHIFLSYCIYFKRSNKRSRLSNLLILSEELRESTFLCGSKKMYKGTIGRQCTCVSLTFIHLLPRQGWAGCLEFPITHSVTTKLLLVREQITHTMFTPVDTDTLQSSLRQTLLPRFPLTVHFLKFSFLHKVIKSRAQK